MFAQEIFVSDIWNKTWLINQTSDSIYIYIKRETDRDREIDRDRVWEVEFVFRVWGISCWGYYITNTYNGNRTQLQILSVGKL